MNETPSNPASPPTQQRIAGRIAQTFVRSKLTPLVIIGALFFGFFSTLQTPREEEPQIVVPMLDVFVQLPGASADEVSERITAPMEKLVSELPGVEYVYSISHPGLSMLIVRFYVGTKQEDALVRAYNKLYGNLDLMPPGASQPIIKERSIDNVPILALTLWGSHYDAYQLRRIAAELEQPLKQVNEISEITLIGGQQRKLRVLLDAVRLSAYQLTPGGIVQQLQATNSRGQAGSFAVNNREFQVDAGNFFTCLEDVEKVVVAVRGGRPVYLRDVVSSIQDGPAEPSSYVLFGAAPGTGPRIGDPEYAAVTLTLAKRPGANATAVAEQALDRVSSLRGSLLAPDLNVIVTRNHLLLATLSVTLLVALALGWRPLPAFAGFAIVVCASSLAYRLAGSAAVAGCEEFAHLLEQHGSAHLSCSPSPASRP